MAFLGYIQQKGPVAPIWLGYQASPARNRWRRRWRSAIWVGFGRPFFRRRKIPCGLAPTLVILLYNSLYSADPQFQFRVDGVLSQRPFTSTPARHLQFLYAKRFTVVLAPITEHQRRISGLHKRVSPWLLGSRVHGRFPVSPV